MVFNSIQFILLFLPVTYVAFLLAYRVGGWSFAFGVLAAASLAFYAQWSVTLVAILIASTLANFLLGNVLIGLSRRPALARIVLWGAIAGNLGTLGYFKYTNFLLGVAGQITGTGHSALDIILPVGISFYTFIQIGYLVEAANGQVERPKFANYLLFATFFPCVTAGPLVLQREFFPQLSNRSDSPFNADRLAVGLTLFGIGLFKKVVLADSIAPYADQAFDAVAAGAAIDFANAWAGSLAYSLQLYFDFSGYSDMAIGLGFVFGIKLPLNFNSPFKATNISDFWRRWHMTMTRFFTTYLYTPMAMGSMRRCIRKKHGSVRKFLSAAAMPIIFTFLMAGIWHGAGWSFVVYGLIHGFALAINHAWREFSLPQISPQLGWSLTMAVVVSSLVVFRAPDLATAGTMLSQMWGLALLMPATAASTTVALDFSMAGSLIVALGTIVLVAPNAQTILGRLWVSTDARPEDAADIWGFAAWRPNFGWALATATIVVVAITSIGAGSSFLYYQF